MKKQGLSRLSRMQIAMQVIRRRHPDMDASEIAAKAMDLIPSDLNEAEIIDPNTFFLHDTRATK